MVKRTKRSTHLYLIALDQILQVFDAQCAELLVCDDFLEEFADVVIGGGPERLAAVVLCKHPDAQRVARVQLLLQELTARLLHACSR
jgi:hypothetical protein